MSVVTPNAARWRSVRAHALLKPAKDIESAVVAAGGIYGAAPTCYLSLAARVAAFQPSDLDRVLYEKRSLVRVPAMRGSIYMLPVELAPCGLALAGTSALAGMLQRVGLDAAQYRRVAGAIEDVLAAGPGTAAEIRRGLGSWREPHEGLLTLLLRQMSYEGRIVRGRVRGGWRSQTSRQEALRRLAHLYFAANGPATPDDFAWWAGASSRSSECSGWRPAGESCDRRARRDPAGGARVAR